MMNKAKLEKLSIDELRKKKKNINIILVIVLSGFIGSSVEDYFSGAKIGTSVAIITFCSISASIFLLLKKKKINEVLKNRN